MYLLQIPLCYSVSGGCISEGIAEVSVYYIALNQRDYFYCVYESVVCCQNVKIRYMPRLHVQACGQPCRVLVPDYSYHRPFSPASTLFFFFFACHMVIFVTSSLRPNPTPSTSKSRTLASGEGDGGKLFASAESILLLPSALRGPGSAGAAAPQGAALPAGRRGRRACLAVPSG